LMFALRISKRETKFGMAQSKRVPPGSLSTTPMWSQRPRVKWSAHGSAAPCIRKSSAYGSVDESHLDRLRIKRLTTPI
jgi:hypothetical protein